tara:strand:+ start:189 stop:929 length:741 start_codon:yes stop_codon:yes gene_type:complete
MPTSKPDQHRNAFGQSYRFFREQNGISQQQFHVLCEAAGIKLYNSQFSHLEQGKLELKSSGFSALRDLNKIIASGKYPPTVSQVGKFTKEVKDKFKQAEPYLDIDNEPIVDAYMFFALFIGEADINPKYKMESIKITEDVCQNIGDYGRTVFSGFATDEMMSKKEAWESFVPHIEKVVNKKQLRRIQSVFAGQADYTIEEVNLMTNGGKKNSCVVNEALTNWTGKQMPLPVDVWTKGSKIKWPQLA